MWIAITPLITAFLWRWKGMAHNWGTTVNRLTSWVLPVGLFMLWYAQENGYPLYYAGLSALTTWLGITLGHSKWQDDAVRSYWGMSWITAARIFLMLLPFYANENLLFYANENLLWLPLLGILAWPACWLGYKANAWGWRLGALCDPNKGSEWGELFIGLLPYGVVFMVLISK